MKGSALLLGNGINLLTAGAHDWKSVLTGLSEKYGLNDVMTHYRYKPFTLIYEEIALRIGIPEKRREIDLKRDVCDLMKRMRRNKYHAKLLDAPVKHILTTNYDYSIARSGGSNGTRANLRPETRYNVFRRRSTNNKWIWHIHGELDAPNTITLGHEQYSGQLQKVREYATSDRRDKNKIKSPFKLGQDDFDDRDEPYSWVDVFFRDDIHIAGFGLEYNEIEIWWLLSYKERLRQRSGFEVGKTCFYHAQKSDDGDHVEAKLGILKSLNVDVVKVPISDSYAPLYDELLLNLST